MARPVGQRPMEERSDWTEQDLLTIDEATGRITQEMDDVRAELKSTTDPDQRAFLERRLQAMQAVQDRFAH